VRDRAPFGIRSGRDELHDRVNDRFRGYPWYAEPTWAFVPHLTVAQGDEEALALAESTLAPALPLAAEARAVWLIVEAEPGGRRWDVRAETALGRAGAS